MEQVPQPARVDAEAAVLPTSETVQPNGIGADGGTHQYIVPNVADYLRTKAKISQGEWGPTRPDNRFRDWLRGRWSWSSSDSGERTTSTREEIITNLEFFFYRYSILSRRLKVLQHCVMEKAETNEGTMGVDIPDEVQRDLDQYTQALRDYKFFRTEGQDLFHTEQGLDTIFRSLSLIKHLETAGHNEPHINDLRGGIRNIFRTSLLETTSGMSKARQAREKRALWERVSMAIGGGLALVVPMIIMVLHPTKLTAMLTTSLFVIAVAVFLAVFMSDSQPKDVVACTVAYAAVLVVFVGAGGGT